MPLRSMILLITAVLAATCPCQIQSVPMKVGIYANSSGAMGIYDALKNNHDIQAEMLLDVCPSIGRLFQYDVLVIGSLKGTDQANIRTIRAYAGGGGGVLIHHDACGYRGWTEPLFPEIARGVRTTTTTEVLPVMVVDHAITANLPVEFTLAYSDHVVLECGTQGVILVRNKDGAPAVIAGELGHGRVVANGAITGYWSDMALQRQGEGAPRDGELQLLLNALKWVGANPLTALTAEVLESRQSAALLPPAALPDGARAHTGWFADEMLRGGCWIHPPVRELDGKFIMFCDRKGVVQMDRARLALYLRQLKWLGVTDILYNSDFRQGRIWRPTGIARELLGGIQASDGHDPLLDVVELAADAGLDVWAMWHCGRTADSMAARDGAGQPYMYQNHNMLDVLSPAFRALCRALVDEYADCYNRRGNFKGIYCDELFKNYVDFHGDDLALFAQFCRKQFNEALPDDVGAKLDRRTNWCDPADKWWRRYVLFKNHVNTDFVGFLAENCRRRGLHIMVEMRDTAQYPTGWAWGMDNEALARIGAAYNVHAKWGLPNEIDVAHVGNGWGQYLAHIKGRNAAYFFQDNQLLHPVVYGWNPNILPWLERFIRQCREWAGSENLARVGILYNQNALLLLHGDKAPEQARKAGVIAAAMGHHQGVNNVLAGMPECFAPYRVLIAPPDALRGLAENVTAALLRYIRDGGVLVNMSGWSTATADLTNENEITAQIQGAASNGAADGMVHATMLETPGGTTPIPLTQPAPLPRVGIAADAVKTLWKFAETEVPAVTESVVGAGRIVGVHFDLPGELSRGNNALKDEFAQLMKQIAHPEITTTGAVKIVSTLRKNNWISVALMADDVPARGTVSVDLAALGMTNATFRVLMLGKGMEIARPGDWSAVRGVWSADEIRAGIKVTIVKNTDENLELPDKFDLSACDGKHSFPEHVMRKGWRAAGARKRNYEYEKIVIMPADEISKGRP